MEELHDDETEFEFSKQGLPSNVRRIAMKSARDRVESLQHCTGVSAAEKKMTNEAVSPQEF